MGHCGWALGHCGWALGSCLRRSTGRFHTLTVGPTAHLGARQKNQVPALVERHQPGAPGFLRIAWMVPPEMTGFIALAESDG